MASVASLCVLDFPAVNFHIQCRRSLQVRCLSGTDSLAVNKNSLVEKTDEGLLNGRLNAIRIEKKSVKDDKMVSENLNVLWDDGFGTNTVKHYLDESMSMIRPDGGPPRWFCPVECGQPLLGSPILLFLPGLDGVGLGLILHHKALGRVFEVQCLHIPVQDRTPFPGLVKFVEETVRLEHSLNPSKPIYLVGDSFGGCLALAVAARNPTIDLVLVLVNPATPFGKSQLQPLLPILEALPDELHVTVPYLLSFVMGDPMKMAMVDVDYKLPPRLKLEKLRDNLVDLLPLLSGLSQIVPKETLLWKLKILRVAASYANSRLHAVNAQVLLLASGKDNMLPSINEARRLKKSLKKCEVRHFNQNGHTLLLEDGLNLLTIIKGTRQYRRAKKLDCVSDFIPPSMSEFNFAFDRVVGLLRLASSSAFFSTLQDGSIVKGLDGIPNEGPVLLVGYHNLLGLELYSLVEEFLRDKNIMLRGIAHPIIFSGGFSSSSEFSIGDWLSVMGALPVAGSNLYKLLSTKSHVLLYPGGAREALHYKGEEYKLFWPDQPEFVRMAARFGATIVPFAAVGEDDIVDLALDYNDIDKIPVLNDFIRESNRNAIRVRHEAQGEVSNQTLYFPGVIPKIPGRFYFLFGKPMQTKGMENVLLKDKEAAKRFYLQIKSEVEGNIAYLLNKRDQDPYRSIIDRTLYRILHSPLDHIPSFKP